MDDLENFVDFLFDGLEGFAYAPVKKKTGAFVQSFFQLPEKRQELISHIQNQVPEGDVYLGPALYKTEKVSKENVKACQVAWAEYDGSVQIDLRGLVPSAVVQTSIPSHQHVYFRVDLPITDIEDVNRRLVKYLSADTSGYDITQILRPPGTRNYKQPKNWKAVKLLSLDSNIRTSFDRVPIITPPSIKEIKIDSLPLAVEVLNRAPSIQDYMDKKRPLLEDRSKHLVAVGYMLAESGFNELEILSVLLHLDGLVQKYVGRDNQLMILAQIAQQAVDKVAEREIEIIAQYEVYTLTNLQTLERKHDFLVDGWLPKAGLMMIAGEPGVGKTQLGLQLSYCLDLGAEFLGKRTQKCKVGFLTMELPPEALKTFVIKQMPEVHPSSTMIVIKEPFDFDVSDIEALTKIHELDVLVIDSLSDLTIEELEESVSKKLFKKLSVIRRRTGVALVLIHHIRKLQSNQKRKEITLSDLYGSMIFAKESDAVIALYETEEALVLQELKVRYSRRADSKDVKRNESLLFEIQRSNLSADRDSGTDGDSKGTRPKFS